MATIKLNGVDTDLQTILGTDDNDKLTATGECEGHEVQLLAGKDLVEFTAGEEAFLPVENAIVANAGTGKDRLRAEDGLVTVTGKLNGGDDEDTITVARADGAILQGGKDADQVHVGSAEELDVAGSRAAGTGWLR